MAGARPDTWMPLYIGDYMADTMHLSHAQHGIYLLLIMAYWRNGGPLPDDWMQLAAVAKCTRQEWQKHCPIIRKFFHVAGGVWTHKRIDAELNISDRLVSVKSESGSRGGNAKWHGSSASANRLTRAQRLSEARKRGTHTREEWQVMLEIFDHSCVRCGESGAMVKDHITPIYQGGSDAIENLQPLCGTCNSSKGPEAIDHRENACHGWQERLAKRLSECLANACEMPTPSPSPSPSPSPDGERESARGRAPGSLSQDGKICQEWQDEAADSRRKAGLPSVNIPAEAAKFLASKTGPPDFGAWIRWALNARSDPSTHNGNHGAGHELPKRQRPTGPPPKPEEAFGNDRS